MTPRVRFRRRDLARRVAALIRDFPEYCPWLALKEFTRHGITQYNRNAVLWRDGMHLIAVVLGAKDENACVATCT